MKKHDLKTLPEYFWAVIEKRKPFEVRKNDRKFKVGDVLVLREWTEKKGYTGRAVMRTVSYILDDPEYCKEGYVVLGFKTEDNQK